MRSSTIGIPSIPCPFVQRYAHFQSLLSFNFTLRNTCSSLLIAAMVRAISVSQACLLRENFEDFQIPAVHYRIPEYYPNPLLSLFPRAADFYCAFLAFFGSLSAPTCFCIRCCRFSLSYVSPCYNAIYAKLLPCVPLPH